MNKYLFLVMLLAHLFSHVWSQDYFVSSSGDTIRAKIKFDSPKLAPISSLTETKKAFALLDTNDVLVENILIHFSQFRKPWLHAIPAPNNEFTNPNNGTHGSSFSFVFARPQPSDWTAEGIALNYAFSRIDEFHMEESAVGLGAMVGLGIGAITGIFLTPDQPDCDPYSYSTCYHPDRLTWFDSILIGGGFGALIDAGFEQEAQHTFNINQDLWKELRRELPPVLHRVKQ